MPITPLEKIDALRRLMKDRGLDAYIVPSSDPHQSEYVAACWQARAWLSGFSGSAGTVVVTETRAGLWTDPRYHLRAAAELQGSGIELFRLGLPGVPAYSSWLGQELPPGSTVGFDGGVVSAAEAASLHKSLSEKGIRLSSQFDLIGEIWQDRPALPSAQIFIQPAEFAGESRAAKLGRVRACLAETGAGSHLVCALDDIAWLLNIRGSDIACNPLVIAYLWISQADACLFIQPEKVPPQVRAALEEDGVNLSAYEGIAAALEQLSAQNGPALIDPEKTSARLHGLVSANNLVKEGPGPTHALKVIKNQVELAGIRQVHLRDGAAVVRWLCWLDRHIAGEQLTEISAAGRLEEFRRQGRHYRGLSFPTIAGYGANSAVGHYSSDPQTAPSLRPTGIFLVDSGAQYLDGTTDITRTLTLGQASPAEKEAFTIILKCHIRLASTRFPIGTNGSHLDAIARQLLWDQGWNCRHGIGHGVGCFLNVHEAPPRFNQINTTPLEAGMLVSNEPGVYFEGRFGIRIENIMVIVPAEQTEFGEFLAAETVSLCPIDLDLVEPGLLDAQETRWLNDYHSRVWQSLAPLLEEEERAWLRHETRPIKK